MKDILRQILNGLIHELWHGLHLPFSVSIFLHEAFVFEHVDVKHLLLSRKLLE